MLTCNKINFMKKIIPNIAAISLFLMIVINGNSQKVYMKVEGMKSGVIKDQNAPAKFADRIELTGYSFETSSPTGSGSSGMGIATGRRARTPLTVTKNNGQSSILLFNCSVTNENLKSVIIEVYKTNNAGIEVLEQTITLSNATISYFKQSFDNTAGSGEAKGPKDEIRFSYQKINFTYVNGGVTAEDNWNSN
jgi:type VI secretion system secreted protein Hcp